MLLIGAVSGCVDSASSSGDEGQASSSDIPDAAPAAFDDETGGIEGTATDDSLNPLAAVSVAVKGPSEATALSDEAGKFSFSNLMPGSYELFAGRLGYSSVAKKVDVVVGEVSPVDFSLVAMAIKESYYTQKDERGIFGCGASWRPAVVYSGVSGCGAVHEVPGDPLAAYDRFLIEWTLEPKMYADWSATTFEMSWQSSQALGAGLSMLWESNSCWNVGAARFASVAGRSPLHHYLDEEALAAKKTSNDGNTCGKGNCGTSKCELGSRVFSQPDTLGATQPADIGVTFQQNFHQFWTKFFNGPGDPAVTMMGDA